MSDKTDKTPAPGENTAPWYITHLEKIVAGILAIMGLVAVICGRDSYVVGIVGAALGYLFGRGRSALSK
jgi:hypothetical protein